ncbi:hypothetical protein [Paraburkholderia caribensis]|uniref:hypothetical protein n=1 Tax=Paraburkholderia caribensis TaxID=75105 RepID=UPI001D091669|nr:hypothetical protein [Paraburkholderia caribensis]
MNTYYWLGDVHIAEKLASMPPDSACPRADLERLSQSGVLRQTRFSPGLEKSINDFIDGKEHVTPGSTRLLREATACSTGAADKIAACMCSNVKPLGLAPRYWFPEDHTSQLRERKIMEKSDLQWMRMSHDSLANFDFWVHITFSLRELDARQPDEASASAVDFPPDELVRLRQAVVKGLPAYLSKVENSPTYDDFMNPLEQFVVLQRFVRSGLSGKLGPDFPASRLVELSSVTRPYVPFQRTIRWEAADPSIDAAAILKKADAHAAEVYKSWRDDMFERRTMHKPICDAVSR